MTFDLAVTPGVAAEAALLGLAIGCVGGLLPALRCVWQPLLPALRQG